jgi:hypothetical protein
MKKCSYCGAEYSDEASVCSVDQTRLDGACLEEIPEVAPDIKRNSDEPLNDQRQAFKPILAAYRRNVKIFFLCFFAGLLTVFTACALRMRQSRLLGGFFLLCAVVGFITRLRCPRLICPACSADTCSHIDHYCPECGSSHLTDRSIIFGTRCSGCGKQLKNGSYTIHFCTNCGAYLDEKGFRVPPNARNFPR